jgi:hypothetical protein
MNFGNDFSNNLTGWQGVVGTAPGVLGLATDVVNLAPPVVKSKVSSGFVVTPASVSGKNGTTLTVFTPDLLRQGTALYVVARFSPTAFIGVKIDNALMCYLVEYHTGAEHVLASVDLTPMLPPGTTAPLNLRLSFYGTNLVAFAQGTQVIEATCTVITEGLAGFGFVGTPLGTEIADSSSGALDLLDNSGTARIDCEYNVLAAAGYPGTISEKELAFLQAYGATSKNLMDAWGEFLDAQGETSPGTLIDRRHNWLLGLMGVSDAIGSTWIDLWKAFWCEFVGDLGPGPGVPPALARDPFFTTPIDTVWFVPYWGPVGGYAEADVWLTSIDTGLYQSEPWSATGLPVTFHVRLKEALTAQSTWAFVLVSDDGQTTDSIGTVNIPSGGLYGTVRILLPTVASNMKSLGFGFSAGPAGGVHVESFGMTVAEADGGLAQSNDPYFNAPSAWALGGPASIANNRLTMGAGSATCAQSLAATGIVVGDTVEVRCFVATAGNGTVLLRAGGTAGAVTLSAGWNAFTMVMGNNRNFQILNSGVTAPWLIDFFFAWTATPVKQYVAH